jgi:hypothetical protein
MDRTAPGSGLLTETWLNPDGEAMMPADKSLTLSALSGHESRLSGFDFDKLARRAQEQLAAVEEQRLAVAVDALSG